MSYLDWPRLVFAGRFQADTSTVNNDVRHYKSDVFEPQFQAPMVGYGQGGGEQRTNGYWNPDGTGAWRMLGCQITGVFQESGLVTDPAKAPVLGARIAGSNSRVAGKLVDLDPQQQLVSQIWGLQIALEDAQGQRLLDSHFDVAPFIDLWKRQQIQENFDQTLAAAYQSTLSGLRWGDLSAYPSLRRLRDAAACGRLSIRFNVFGFDRDPAADDYTTGVVVGSIGPAAEGEPRHFTLGRRLEVDTDGKLPLALPLQVFGFQAVDHVEAKVLSVDLGNSLPIYTAAGAFLDLGALSMAVARRGDVTQGEVLKADEVEVLGPVDYLSATDWYFRSAALVDFSYAGRAWLEAHLRDHPLVLLRTLNGRTPETRTYQVLVRETQEGLYARADNFVFRLEPGAAPSTVDFYLTRYGQPIAGALTMHFDDPGVSITNPGTGAVLNPEKWPVPPVGTPVEALIFEQRVEIDASGRGQLLLANRAEGPGTPRHYLDGQIYGLSYSIEGAPEGFTTNFWNFLSVLAYDAWEVPDEPTWHGDIAPILTQYANLYPIMSRYLVNLADYDSVVKHADLLLLSFTLDIENPNYMPVSRDLSVNKRAGIVRWLSEPGKPRRGRLSGRSTFGEGPPPWAPPDLESVPDGALEGVEPGGKFDFLMRMLKAGAGTDDTEGGGHAED
ncbi:MAG: hypothetical protein H6741_22995 [Alphaproteobacteria bacterium]|nr:hypothetical protein [Alphaproteobacteria bacterium]